MLSRKDSISVKEHEEEWDEIFAGISDVVDACAFQDGQIDYHELDAFFEVNKRLADKYGLKCWTNAESFDRDMPIKFSLLNLINYDLNLRQLKEPDTIKP